MWMAANVLVIHAVDNASTHPTHVRVGAGDVPRNGPRPNHLGRSVVCWVFYNDCKNSGRSLGCRKFPQSAEKDIPSAMSLPRSIWPAEDFTIRVKNVSPHISHPECIRKLGHLVRLQFFQ